MIIMIISASFSVISAQKQILPPNDTLRTSSSDSVESFKYVVINFRTVGSGFKDGGKVYTSPLHWKGKDWLKVVALGGAGIVIHQLDAPINDVVYSNNSPFTRGFSNAFEPLGNPYYVLPALIGTYLYAHAKGHDELSGLTITAGKAVIITNAIATWTKLLAHRHRPNEDTPSLPNQWDGPRANFKNTSFFSTHTATSFALASVVSSTYSDHKWVPFAAYSMASLISASRLAGKDHWATDVFVGAVIGYSVGKLVYKLNRSKKIKLVIGL
jgi:membrane-associated phospholipid phosphatase